MEDLKQLYQIIDQKIRKLSIRHRRRLHCQRGCCGCCIDKITVFEVEAGNIQYHYQELLEQGIPHQPGACAFLDKDGACRIYPHRPYVCRIEGLPLRWVEKQPDGNWAEMRDICPLNEEGEPVEVLPNQLCWNIGIFKAALAKLQAEIDGGILRRVSLRSLFKRPPE